MSKKLRIALAQMNSYVGAVQKNSHKIVELTCMAQEQYEPDIIVFPELAICGYPPEDLLFRNDFLQEIEGQLQLISEQVRGVECIIGAPIRHDGALYNSAVRASNGVVDVVADKQVLPNYGVFDEKRYFAVGATPGLMTVAGVNLGVTICEDIWEPGPVARVCALGAEAVININASPYHIGKLLERRSIVKQRCLENGVPIFYVHLVGGQDEVVFDGASFVCDQYGEIVCEAEKFIQSISIVDMSKNKITPNKINPVQNCIAGQSECSELEDVYQALVLAVRDYVSKNGFDGVAIGLSGGVDSALTLAIAVAALGSENVETVMMPSQYTSEMSLEDAQALAKNYSVSYEVISIEPVYQLMLEGLNDAFAGLPADTTEENLQARCRGTLLMAISNKRRRMVLATGNKSEMSVGYATLYGDMAGGFAPLKDVSKTMVYQLCELINRDGEKIPQRILTRAPSAELAAGQEDQDSLPPYDQLDRILQLYIEQGQSVKSIAAQGFDHDVVSEVIRKVNLNEYKRRQAAPGVKITQCAFGRERRYPITSGFDKTE